MPNSSRNSIPRREWFKHAAIGALTFTQTSLRAADSDRPKNVIFLLADQLRADCLGCYGTAELRIERPG